MKMKMKSVLNKSQITSQFQDSIQLVLSGKFRRLQDFYIDQNNEFYQLTIYRCSDTIVRVEFKKINQPPYKATVVNLEEIKNGKKRSANKPGRAGHERKLDKVD
jgi:hypothetical protein